MKIDADIMGLDLEPIAYKVCRDERWSTQKIDQVELQYRAFLQAFRNFGEKKEIAPTRDIDIFWHHHILDTSLYIEHCRRIFGVYLHHYPYSGIFSADDARIQHARINGTVAAIGNILDMKEF